MLVQSIPSLLVVIGGLLRIEKRLTRVETILEIMRNNNIKKGGN